MFRLVYTLVQLLQEFTEKCLTCDFWVLTKVKNNASDCDVIYQAFKFPSWRRIHEVSSVRFHSCCICMTLTDVALFRFCRRFVLGVQHTNGLAAFVITMSMRNSNSFSMSNGAMYCLITLYLGGIFSVSHSAMKDSKRVGMCMTKGIKS